MGDKNSKYFHAQTKCRRARNRIVGLFDSDDVWATKDKDIFGIAANYFENLFTTTNSQEIEHALREVNTVITEDINGYLTAPPTEKEIHAAFFMMHPDKALGLDGMTAVFFQKAWGVIKDDLLILVNSFFRMGSLIMSKSNE